MIKKIKEYLEYRKNRTIAKRELARMAAAALPAVREISDKGCDIVMFLVSLTKAAGTVSGERLLEMVLHEVSEALQTEHGHIMDILTYMAGLSTEEIRRILVHSAAEVMPANATGKASAETV